MDPGCRLMTEQIDVLDIGVVRGRGFTPEEQGLESGVAMISEATADELKSSSDALGQVIELRSLRGPRRRRARRSTPPSSGNRMISVAHDAGGDRGADDVLELNRTASCDSERRHGRDVADRADSARTAEHAQQGLGRRLTKVDPRDGREVLLAP